jgi:putative transposase
VLEWMERAIAEHGAPAYLSSDNGPEFIAKEVQRWLTANAIKTIYIEPGSPWQNGFAESFHGRFRDECLNREQLWTLTEARVVTEDYCCQYTIIGRTASLVTKALNASQLPFHLRLQSPFGLLTPKMDKPKQRTNQ